MKTARTSTTRRWTALSMAFCVVAGAGGARAQSLWDDPAFGLYRQAVEAVEQKQYERASQLAREAIAQYPDHLLAHYLLGQAALARSEWSEAVEAFARVVKLYPRSFAGQRELGTALERGGRLDEAQRAYEAALALQPDNQDVRLRLAFALLNANQAHAAIRHLETLAEQGRASPDVWLALGRAQYEQGDLGESEKSFTRAAGLRDEGRTWFNLGVVRLRLGDPKGALAAFERAAKHPEVRDQAQPEVDKLRASLIRRDSGTPGSRPPGATQNWAVPRY